MVDRNVGGQNISPSEAGTQASQEIERRMAAERDAQRQADADASRRAQSIANQATARPAKRDGKRHQQQAAPRQTSQSPKQQKSDGGSFPVFMGCVAGLASALYVLYAMSNRSSSESFTVVELVVAGIVFLVVGYIVTRIYKLVLIGLIAILALWAWNAYKDKAGVDSTFQSSPPSYEP